MGRQAWKKGAFLTVSLLSAAFFGRLERISRTVYLGETEEQEFVRKTETEKEPPETAVETIIETETEETEKQTEVKKETGRIRVLIRSDDFAELSHEELRILCKEKGLLLEKGEEKPLEKEEELFFSAEASLKTGESVMLTGKTGRAVFLFWDSNGDTKILFLRGVLRFFGEKKVSFSSMNCRWRAISGR